MTQLNALSVHRLTTWATKALCILATFVASGCGNAEPYAPVKGTVTLNGKPLDDAKLIFEPIGDESGVAFGKPSYGKTDRMGQYTLNCPIAGEPGAAVGQHRVRITTMKAAEYTDEQIEKARKKLQQAESAGGSSATVTDQQVMEYLSDQVIAVRRDTLPAKYNTETELTITVPPEGTETADFALTTP